jgi:hypothetical protein
MIVPRLVHLILVIWCAFSDGYDLSERKQPQGPLGITLDLGLARSWPPSIDDRGSDAQRTGFIAAIPHSKSRLARSPTANFGKWRPMH